MSDELPPHDELAARIIRARGQVRALVLDASKGLATRDVAQLAATLVQLCELCRVQLVVRR